MKRTIIVSLSLFFAWCLVLGLGMEGCKPTSTTNEKSTTDGGSNTPKDGTSTTDKPPTRRRTVFYKAGDKVNECTGTAACDAQRDLDAQTGRNLPGTCHEGLCTPNPTGEAKIENGKIDVSCLSNPPKLPTGPDKATWVGPVETFGLQSNTTGITVEAFDYEKDPDLKTPLASFTAEAAQTKGTCTGCKPDQVCFYNSCVKNKTSDGNEIGYFVLKDLPTNKLLVLRTSGPNLVTTIQYNLWIPADKVTKIDGVDIYKHRAFAITVLTRGLIPPTAGIRLPKSDEAVIAGEIHDCNDKTVEGARVSISILPMKLTYFDGNGENPDPDQEWTNRDGIYAALNIKVPSPNDILLRAVVKVGGKDYLIGKFKAKIFEDTATILTTTPWYPGIK